MRKAQDWAIRCQLELQSHNAACWATLTYDEKHLPPTLSKAALSGFVKRLRRKHETRTKKSATLSPIRFFGCGEYGERNGRPHYHVILYGTDHDKTITSCWRQGFVQVDPLTPAAIAYVAGYTAKKVGQHRYNASVELVDESTGEVYTHQDPFVLMSRRPGIGSNARAFWRSWRDSAIWHGREVPVPRYLHDSYKANATETELEKLRLERNELLARIDVDLKAAGAIALAKHHRKQERRSL